jgi:hypothetical protein
LARQKSGSNRAFILALLVILGGIYLMATGKDGWGFATIISSLAALVTVFALGRSAQQKERVEKETAIQTRQNR